MTTTQQLGLRFVQPYMCGLHGKPFVITTCLGLIIIIILILLGQSFAGLVSKQGYRHSLEYMADPSDIEQGYRHSLEYMADPSDIEQGYRHSLEYMADPSDIELSILHIKS